MKLSENFALSFELFPPKTPEGITKLQSVCQQFNTYQPDYFSVTFGAGGALQTKTTQVVESLCAQKLIIAPHLSCIAMTREKLSLLLQRYTQLQIKKLVVIRGDNPLDGTESFQDFHYANELVSSIRAMSSDQFDISVAAYPEFHPQAIDYLSDLKNFKRKVDAGADRAITQFFFNSDAYFQFLRHCHHRNIQVPIIPGIMPIANYERLARFAQSCGAEIPLWIRKRLEKHQQDPHALQQAGIEIVTDLCLKLLENNVSGLHFYTLNNLEPTRSILANLGFKEKM